MRRLISEILEELEFDRLLEEGKDPVEILSYKYQNVPYDIINQVVSIDPTKKKSYSQWLLSKWNEESNVITKNLQNGRIAKLFQHYKEHSDIQIKDCPSVSEGLRDFVPEEDTVLTKSNKPTTYVANLGKEVDSELANDFDIVFNQDNWIIAVPHTYEAECKLGENMKWCTANSFGNGEYYYKRYLNDYGGKYYVNFDMSNGESRLGKDYPFTRYQFHFESNQFKDKEDDQIGLDDLGMPESVIGFYENEGFDVSEYNYASGGEYYEDEEDDEEENDYATYLEIMDRMKYTVNQYFNLNVYINTDITDVEDLEDISPEDEYSVFYLFNCEDDEDYVAGSSTFNNPRVFNDVIVYNSDNLIILKDTADDYVFAYSYLWNGRRHYYTRDMDKHLPLPQIDCYCLTDTDGDYYFIYNNPNVDAYDFVDFNEDCDTLFINNNINSNDGIFVEAIRVDGKHSLFFADSSSVKMIIKDDTPKNGNCFTVNAEGIIEGSINNYDLDKGPYQTENSIKNGNYLVSNNNTASITRQFNKYLNRMNEIRRI